MTPGLYTAPYIRISFANLCTLSSFGSFFLFPLFVTGRGGTEADIGVVMGAFALASVLCRPWISEMIDRIGRKRSCTIGSILMSILPVTFLFFRGDLNSFYLPLILARLLHGVGFALYFTGVFTYVADIVPQRRLNEGLGMFGITGLAGLAIGPVLAEITINTFGFSVFFLSAAGMAAIGLWLHLFLPESYLPPCGGRSPSFFSLLFRRKILIVAMLAVIFGFGRAASTTFVAPFALMQQLTFISFYYLAYSFAAVATRLLGGKLADKIGEERIIPYGLVLLGLGLLLVIFLGGTMVLVISGLLAGCGHGFLYPCLNALAVRDEPDNVRGKITGIFTGGFDAGTFVGCIILGYIGEWAGFRILFLVAGLVPIAGLGAYKLQTSVVGLKETPRKL